jgi:hypothetical protein
MPQDAGQLYLPPPFALVLDKLGPPDGAGPVTQAEAEQYREQVPEALIEFWLTHGRGSWRSGLYWLCDPEPLMPVVRTLFRNDPEIDAELCVPYVRDAFGELTLWHPKLKLISVSFHLGEVSNTDITTQVIDGIRHFDDNISVASAADIAVIDGCGWVSDATGGPVFDAVLKRLGPIREDQIYVMTPPFRMGGEGAPDDFSIGGLVEYLGFLAQLGPFTRMRYVDPKDGGRKPFGHSEPVRTIGHDRLID